VCGGVGEGQNPGRQASVSAGIPYSVPSTIVNMLCGSGLRSVIMATLTLQAGQAKVIVAGGQESMSKVGKKKKEMSIFI
jgi:acetyl-CoA C-acetyltransferase